MTAALPQAAVAPALPQAAAPPVLPAPWRDALLAARLFAVAPHALGGVVVRGGAGPARDAWAAYLAALLPKAMPQRRVPLGIADERLLGGLDLAATLATDHAVARRGVLAECDGGVVTLAMAERIDIGTAARIAAVLDAGAVRLERDGLAQHWPAKVGLVAYDEAQGDEDRLAPALAERLAFVVDLDGIALRDAVVPQPDTATIAAACARRITVDDAALETLVGTAMAFGIGSARAPLLALAAARAHAALAGRDHVHRDDLLVAARLVLAPRATQLPPAPEDQAEAAPPPESDTPDSDTPETQPDIGELTDMLIAATLAQLPDGVLAAMAAGGISRQAAGSGQGQRRKSKLRGRPAGVRAGALGAGVRLNLIETLRAASAWQKLRPSTSLGMSGVGLPVPSSVPIGVPSHVLRRVIVRPEDFRIQRFIERAESTTIFVVDASGSAALARLAETKGAVELLLAEAYVRRTQVALIVFRGAAAELLLPPTRSLARAKRCLIDMVGGGGTPLASAIETALLLAHAAKSKGRTPFTVFLTDGRGNIGLDGSQGRPQGEADALAAAKRFAAARLASVFIDTAPRPRPEGAAVAAALGARYAPLPLVEATRVRDVVNAFDPSGKR